MKIECSFPPTPPNLPHNPLNPLHLPPTLPLQPTPHPLNPLRHPPPLIPQLLITINYSLQLLNSLIQIPLGLFALLEGFV
jgi:hypothetical protein